MDLILRWISVSRATYALLIQQDWNDVGVGNGSTTIIPDDLRGRFIRSWDASRSVDTAHVRHRSKCYHAQPHTFGFVSEYGHTRQYTTQLQTEVANGAANGNNGRSCGKSINRGLEGAIAYILRLEPARAAAQDPDPSQRIAAGLH
jgi:hypothetical protein